MLITPEVRNTISLEFSALARTKNSNNEKIISLGLGEPSFNTPKEIIEAAHQAMIDGYNKYSNPYGLYELREALQYKLKKDNDIDTKVDNIIVTPGAKNALMLALFALLEPNDEVINILPSYVSYIPQIKIGEPSTVIHNIDLKKDFSIDFEKIEKSINSKTKAILLNTPHNPTGKMLSKEEFDKFVELMEKYPQLFILSDEIYEKLNFSNEKHYSLGSVKKIAQRVITINGFSKTYSMTGWRLGYIVVPDCLISDVVKFQQHINTHTALFIQKAAVTALKLEPSFVENFNNSLKINADNLVKYLSPNSKLDVVPSQGGMFSFVNIEKLGIDSDVFATKLLEKYNVALTPGKIFGESWNSYIRISLVTTNKEFEEAMKLINKFISEDL